MNLAATQWEESREFTNHLWDPLWILISACSQLRIFYLDKAKHSKDGIILKV